MSAAGRRPDVCVVGSANHDVVFDVERIPAPGETVLARDRSSGPGGKGLNQAVAAARAGASVAFVGSVGSDEAGSLLRATLTGAGVDVGSLRTVSGPTGSAVVLRARDGENAIVVSAGANGVDFEWDDAARLRVRSGAVVLCQQEVPQELIAAVVSYARADSPAGAEGPAGAEVVLNAAPAVRVSPAVLAGVHVLVVNEHELDAQLAPDPRAEAGALDAAASEPAATLDPADPVAAVDLFEAVDLSEGAYPVVAVDLSEGADPVAAVDPAEALVRSAAVVPAAALVRSLPLVRSVAVRAADLVTSARAVVVTLGAAGAVCVEASGATHVPAAAVDRVVDTTGAGDAFCGALCAALAHGHALVDAARFGCAAGALAVQVAGAAASMPVISFGEFTAHGAVPAPKADGLGRGGPSR